MPLERLSAEPTGRLPTLGDVAALAGVSRSTVSNVVRGSDVVAPRTRRRVAAAIEQLGYRPNALARQLLRGRASTVGVIARDLRNPFTAEMASFVEREVARFGFAAMFCATESDSDREEQAVRLMIENRVSGLVFLSYLENPGLVGSRINGQTPTVFIAADEPWADSVTVNEQRGGELVAEHLIELGHRRLAFVGPTSRDRADSRRLEGFMRIATSRGLEPAVIAWDPPDGKVMLDDHAASWSEILTAGRRVTGIFAANDFAAIDLLDVADSIGIRVPKDLSIVGFDDVAMASLRRINLTTVSQRREELVRLGIETLRGRIDGRIAGEPRVTLAGVTLVQRGSTAPAHE
ncbi:MAG TPA: LacI family DNA-binding transcriptional regulator [Candidatus Limnocylindrales bacterium]|jgi:DNA-binding LacI/PurR family transcriptional regulator